jgi:hypothetical protein
MKKLFIALIVTLSPLIQANWLPSSNDQKELTVRLAALVIGFYGVHTMVNCKSDEPVKNIIRVPVGLALATAGIAGMVFAPEIVTQGDNFRDGFREAYYDAKFRNSQDYTASDALNHAWLKFKSLRV